MKRLNVLLLSLATSLPTMAGGYLTNTNQSISFLRNPAQDACIGISSLYNNPSGIGFMSKGWHVGFNIQNVHQTRTIESFWGTPKGSSQPGFFALGEGNSPSGVKTFHGKAKAPVFPTLDLAYVGKKWFAAAHLGVTGGGGKAVFHHGLGLFESQVSLLPTIVQALQPQLAPDGKRLGYTANSYVRGRQYYLGGQANVGWKVNKHISLSAGARVVYVTNNYYGYVRDISVTGIAPQAIGLPAGAGEQTVLASQLLKKAGYGNLAALATDKELNCDQTGWGITPILGVDYNIGRWNLAMTWELKTKLRLDNRSGMNTSGIDEFDDGRIIPADLPAYFTIGAQYTALADSSLRLNVGFHRFRDTKATQYEHREKHLRDDGYEFLAGVEYDLNPRLTLSCGAQYTNYGLGHDNEFINNISFVTDSYSLGLGAKFKVSKKVAVNIAYFKTFYMSYTKHMADYNGLGANMSGKVKQIVGAAANGQIQLTPNEQAALGKLPQLMRGLNFYGEDHFDRTNDVFGIGVEIDI